MERTHNKHRVQLLAPHRTTPKAEPMSESIVQTLLDPRQARCHDHCPGQLSQCPSALSGQHLRRTGLGSAGRPGRGGGRRGEAAAPSEPSPRRLARTSGLFRVGAFSCRALGLSPRATCCSPARTPCARGLPAAAAAGGKPQPQSPPGRESSG